MCLWFFVNIEEEKEGFGLSIAPLVEISGNNKEIQVATGTFQVSFIRFDLHLQFRRCHRVLHASHVPRRYSLEIMTLFQSISYTELKNSIQFLAYAVGIGISKESASFLISILGISNSIGRIAFGWLADQNWVNS